MGTAIRWTAWFLGGAFIVLVILALGAAWRLSEGPVAVDWLTGRVEQTLSRQLGHRVEFGPVRLSWIGRRELLALDIEAPRIVDDRGRILLEARRLKANPDLMSLFTGRMAGMELSGLDARFEAAPEGGFRLIGVDGGVAGVGSGFDPGDEATLLPEEIVLVGASLEFVDGSERFAVSDLDLVLKRQGRKISLEGEGRPRGSARTVSAEAVFRPEGSGTAVEIRFEGLSPGIAARLHDRLDPLSRLRMALGGRLDFGLDGDGRVRRFRLDLEGADGRLVPGDAVSVVDGEIPPGSTPIKSVKLGLSGDSGLEDIAVDALDIRAFGRATRLSGRLLRTGSGARWSGRVAELSSDLLAAISPALDPLAAGDLTVSGAFSLDVDGEGGIASADTELVLGPGRLALPGLLTLPIVGGCAGADWDGERLDIRYLSVDLPGVGTDGAASEDRCLSSADIPPGRIEALGRIERDGKNWRLALEVAGGEFTLDNALDRWPENLAGPARDWIVKHMDKGRISGLSARIATRIGDGGVPEVAGRFSFSEVGARFWEPLPVFRDIRGIAEFDADSFRLSSLSGAYGGVRVEDGSVAFTGLGTDGEHVDISTGVVGPLGDLLGILDDAGGYARALDIDAGGVAGEARFRLKLAMAPLLDIGIDDIAISAAGRVEAAKLPGALAGHDLDRASLDVTVDKELLALSGVGSIGGAEAELEVERRLRREADFQTRFSVRATFSDAARERLGLRGAFRIGGPVKIELSGVEKVDEAAEYRLRADLTGASLAGLPLPWSKPAGRPARVDASFRPEGDGVLDVFAFEAKAFDLDLEGRLRLGRDDFGLLGLELGRLRIGDRTDMTLRVEPDDEGRLRVRAAGARIDLEPFLESGEASDPGSVVIEFQVDEMWVGGDEPLGDAEGQARVEEEGVLWVTASALTPAGAPITLNWTGDASEVNVRIATGGAGSLFRTMGWFSNMEGGTLDFRAKREGADDTYRGRLVIGDFRILRAPVLVHVLGLASLTGLGDALSRDGGVDFVQLVADLELSPSRIAVETGRAHGSAAVVTFRGSVDRTAGKLEVGGTLAPFSLVNRLLNIIPGVGQIATGVDGGGVLAASYALSGPLHDPEVSVQPLTVLVPGLLRDLVSPLLGGESPLWDSESDRPANAGG